MSAAEKISITLTPEMNRIIKQRVAAGDFASSSELIREALRVWQKREDEHRERLTSIRARLQNSIEDPRPGLALKEWRAIISTHAALASKWHGLL